MHDSSLGRASAAASLGDVAAEARAPITPLGEQVSSKADLPNVRFESEGDIPQVAA
jgi:hypothetical protein